MRATWPVAKCSWLIALSIVLGMLLGCWLPYLGRSVPNSFTLAAVMGILIVGVGMVRTLSLVAFGSRRLLECNGVTIYRNSIVFAAVNAGLITYTLMVMVIDPFVGGFGAANALMALFVVFPVVVAMCMFVIGRDHLSTAGAFFLILVLVTNATFNSRFSDYGLGFISHMVSALMSGS